MAHVTGRVRSASESSGLRHLFSSKKKKVAAAADNDDNDEDVNAMIRDGDKEVELDKDDDNDDKAELVDKKSKAQINTLEVDGEYIIIRKA